MSLAQAAAPEMMARPFGKVLKRELREAYAGKETQP
jgi:hypothetical protein